MELILLQDVENLGLRGEVVEVARGYARNFLLPRQLAQVATPGALADVHRRDELRARQEAATADQAQALAAKLAKVELRFDVQSGPTGTLFGSVTPTDIADEIWKLEKIRVDRRKIDIDPIKRIGRYEIPIELFADVVVPVRTLVIPEGGELPPEVEEEPPAPEEVEEEAALVEGEAVVEDVAELSDEELEAAIAAAEQPETPAPVEEPVEGEEDVPEDAFDRAVDAAIDAGSDEESQDRN
jgi:large subunit ribosomal protein L9